MKTLLWLSTGSILLPVLAGIVTLRKHDAALRVLFGLFVVSALVECGNRWLGHQLQSNMWLVNLFLLLQCSTLIGVLSYWSGHFKLNGAAGWSTTIFVAAWIFSVVRQGIDNVNNVVFTLGAVLLIAFAGFALFRLSGKAGISLLRNTQFWFSAAVMILFSVDVTLFSLLDVILLRGDATLLSTWTVHSVFNIFANTLYAIGFLCSFPPAK